MGSVSKKKNLGAKQLLLPGADFDVESLLSVLAVTRNLADTYDGVLPQIGPDVSCPQRVMRAALMAEQVVTEAARIPKAFGAFALEHRTGAGGFVMEADQGAPMCLITFPTGGGTITPKWKEEYMKLAREVAEERGESFDESDAERRVRERYQPSKITTKVQIVEAS